MTSRDTYNSSIKTAVATNTSSVHSAEAAKQTTIDASLSVVGYTLQSGNYANLAASIKSAIAANQASLLAAEKAKQASIAAARDTLRGTGDLGAF